MPRKKSVAESVEHLLKPKQLAQSDSEEEDLKFSESLANVNSKQRPSGILKKTVPLLHELDKKYKGVVSYRKDFEDTDEEESESEEDSEDQEDISDDQEDDDSEDQEDAGSDDNDMGISDFISQFKSKVQTDVQVDSGDSAAGSDQDENDSDAEEGDSDESMDEEGGDEEEEEEDGSDSDQEEIDSDGPENESAEETPSSLKILQPAQENNVQKGQAVRTQLDLWERILETRIKVQPVLNKANGFPSADLFSQMEETSEEFTVLARDTQKNVATLLDNLIELQNTMMSQFSETKALLKSGLYKRKFVEEQKQTPAKKLCLDTHPDAEGVFKTYRNSVIQKWSDRTKVTNARNSKELLLNHNVISQIEGVLLNKPDLIKSSQTHKGTYELFGQKKKPEGDEEEEEDQASKDESKWCPEIYDDTDFYHQMLRELIEYKSNSSTNPVEAARNYSELQKLRTKIKKQVDQKASKGRKIRYVVHKKIVSFMAPYSDSNWTEEATQELFTSLFGNYEKTLNRKREAEGADSESEEEEVGKGGESEMKIM